MSGIFDFLQDFEIAKALPEMDRFVSQLAGWLRVILLAGPLVLVVLGLWYSYAPPEEANYSLGFRTKYSMSSVMVWKYAQKIAGRAFLIVGAVMAGVVLVLSFFFGLLGPMGMAVVALLCVIAEGVVIVLLHVRLDKQLQKKFDKQGNPRKEGNSKRA